jgi:hypothetical protein
VLIDGGSALNILFHNALTKLGIKLEDLETYDAPFWGVLLGQTSQPLGQITMLVQFGTADHFCIDYVNFIVANFEGMYHAILGRPTLAKFMVVLHYVYLLLKMSTEKGVLSLKGNVFVAYTFEKESYMTVDAKKIPPACSSPLLMPKKIPPADLEIPSKEATRAAVKSKETKEVELLGQQDQDGLHWC